jgi:hypothetical protein
MVNAPQLATGKNQAEAVRPGEAFVSADWLSMQQGTKKEAVYADKPLEYVRFCCAGYANGGLTINQIPIEHDVVANC